MEEIKNDHDNNLVLSDFVNDWILEPIIDSLNRQNIIFRLTTKGNEYFKILNKSPGYPFKNNPTLKIMINQKIITPIIKKEGEIGYTLTLIGEKHYDFLKTWKAKNEKN
ncbi:MAG: hypothetical protein HOE93_00940 [Nitrosopumilus sp.]|jgi:hypothetical protein|nr:hypothetical protein [Nitrosopumilus sp.]MBT3955869.1 hypothetical protein [Nitrosopumilus sp.]MBT4298612.1 hypothetical protein [Nitrosopumilus sp.]MBT5279364.1 hypothetical protein [Nitrosopumilus sp.]MBT6082953.1 hypothetical protein [Nitrosopumilus sp.]